MRKSIKMMRLAVFFKQLLFECFYENAIQEAITGQD